MSVVKRKLPFTRQKKVQMHLCLVWFIYCDTMTANK